MLKRVPVRGGEWIGWLYRLLNSCNRLPEASCFWPRAGDAARKMQPLFPGFRRRRLQAPTALPRSRPGDRSYATGRASSPCPPPGKNTSRNQAITRPHRPELEPTSASPTDRYQHNQGDPAPITIEAGIHSSPASRETVPHGQEDLGPKPDATHLTTSPRRPAPRTAAAFKAHFWLLFLQPKKVTRPQARSAGRNAVDLEVEVEFALEKPPTPGQGAVISAARNGFEFEMRVEFEVEFIKPPAPGRRAAVTAWRNAC